MAFWTVFCGVVLVAAGGSALFLRFFHRKPVRTPPLEAGAIVAPADGTIWQIVPLGEGSEVEVQKRFLGKIQTLASDVENAGFLLSIFMSPLDAHVNWSPVGGKVAYVRHTPGNFSFANTWKSLWNEKNEILLQADGYKLKVIQIAGFVARRIECWVKEGDAVARGEMFGMIRLGSQVSMILPKRLELRVKAGQKVRGGETVVGVVREKG